MRKPELIFDLSCAIFKEKNLLRDMRAAQDGDIFWLDEKTVAIIRKVESKPTVKKRGGK